MKHHSIGRRLALPGALAAVVLFAVGPVSAALFVTLEPTSGPPGTEVTGRTGGERAFSTQVDPLPTYRVAKAAADTVTSPDGPGLVAIGELVVGAAGNGRSSFRVPQIEPGDYVLVVFCPSCAPFSAGRTMAPVADFRVTPAPPATDTVPVAPASSSALTLVIAALVLAAVLLAAVRLRFSR